jgi:hypothetical protein
MSLTHKIVTNFAMARKGRRKVATTNIVVQVKVSKEIIDLLSSSDGSTDGDHDGNSSDSSSSSMVFVPFDLEGNPWVGRFLPKRKDERKNRRLDLPLSIRVGSGEPIDANSGRFDVE